MTEDASNSPAESAVETAEPTPAEAAGVEPAAAAAARQPEPPHIAHARRFWILSLVNWAIAIVCFGLSSYLGVARPTNMLVYTIIFVIALVAVIVGCLCWVVARFGTEPAPAAGER
ncbi:MAG TPA: hypothetical protein VK576_03310 [Thermoleophilia bacterium]|nr:hypothetical protein [Thermoleophilia bacterium]